MRELLEEVDPEGELPKEQGHVRETPDGNKYWLPY